MTIKILRIIVRPTIATAIIPITLKMDHNNGNTSNINSTNNRRLIIVKVLIVRTIVLIESFGFLFTATWRANNFAV